MKDAIFLALIRAANIDSQSGNNLRNRILGEKEDVVTQADLTIGDSIVQALLATKPGIVVEREEQPYVMSNLEEGEKESYYIAIDDIDGSNNLRVGKGFLPYCSMIVAFDGSKKTEEGYKYSDYTHAACLDYSSRKIFYTEKDLGKVEVYDLDWCKVADSTESMQDNTGVALTLSTDIVSTQRGGKKGYAADKEEPKNAVVPNVLEGVFKRFGIVDSACSVYEYAMIGMGIRNGYVSAGKKQHELPLLYAFASETGKIMMDFDGKRYNNKIYDFNGGDAEVIAAEPEVAIEIQSLIQSQRWLNGQYRQVILETLKRKKEEANAIPKGPAGAAYMRKMAEEKKQKENLEGEEPKI